MNTYTSKHRAFVLGFWLTLTILAAACSPASAPSQMPGGILQQDAPPTPELKAVEIDTDQVPPLDQQQLSGQGCPKVESQLGQIVHGPNPLERARQLGVRVERDKVQVLLVLKGEDATFLQDFEVEIGKQSGTEVQAFVPLSRVCELAGMDTVLAIRLPSQAVVQ